MIKRIAAEDILQGAKSFPVIAIVGPRQSGKTTLARMIFPEHTYISLEDLDMRQAAITDPRTFIQANRSARGMIIDEFQYVPQLLSYIQTIVDQEGISGYFILTGSQNFLMNQAITQSLAGRVSIHTLLPLSIQELANENLLPLQVEDVLYKGFYPAIYAKNIEPDRLYRNYLQTYIERDIRQLTQVGDLATFQNFLGLCASRVGQQLNLTSLGSDCGISDNTAKRWLSVLQASYIIYLLQPYYRNFGKRLIKSPKLYFYDSGLLCHLLKIREQDLVLSPYRGNIFESCIISEFLKWYYNHGKTPSLYFWRDKIGNEVDCILDESDRLISIEIKAGRTVSPHFFKGLNYFNDIATMPVEPSYVVYAGSANQPRAQSNLVSWQSLQQIFGALK